jgi:adenylate cyclase
VERKLAAILAADVVGYTRLMGADEAGTLERLKSLRWELAQPKIAGRSDRRVLAKIRQWLAYSRQPFIL